MLKTKSIYAPTNSDDGVRVLITRFYPRGIRRERFDEWIRELSPSAALLKQYKGMKISRDEFIRRYKTEMDTDTGRDAINDLRCRAAKYNMTLLCYEPDGEVCHRHILFEIIMDERMLHDPFKPRYTDDKEGVPHILADCPP